MIESRNLLSSVGLALLLAVPATSFGQDQKLELAGTIATAADLIEADSGRLYVAAGETLHVVDAAEPSTPRIVGRLALPGKIWAISARGSQVFLACDWSGLAIVDVSDPAKPRLRGSFKTVGQAWGVAIAGTTALVANQMSGIDVVDVSNPDRPVSVGSYFTEGYARDVAASGPLAYIVDQPTGFSVLDLSKAPPVEVSAQQSAQAPLIVEVPRSTGALDKPKVAVVIAGRLLDITGGSRGPGLQIFDVSDPSTPVKVTTFKTPGQAMRVAIEGTFAYVADGSEGVQVVDLADPAQPRVVATYKTTGSARDVAVDRSLVFAAVSGPNEQADPRAGAAGVVILRRAP